LYSKHLTMALKKHVTLADIVRPPIINCTINYTIDQVLKRLNNFGIISMPVYDVENKFPVGRISTWDIATYFVKEPNFNLSQKISQIWPETQGVTEQDIKSFKFGPGGLESIYTFPVDTDLNKLFKIFSQVVHRVLVTYNTDDRENLLQNISQSDVFRYLYTETDLLRKNYLKKTLEELHCIVRPPITIEGNKTVADAIRIMVQGQITALAVIDPESKEVKTTFSSSDLRHLDSEIFKELDHLSLKEFLDRSPHRRLITISSTNTLEDAIKRLVLSHVHRLWECENHYAKGVVSMTDIFKILADHVE